MFLKEKWARFGIKQERDARELDEEEEEEEQELKGVGRISDESPIDEDNLQNLLGPRCVSSSPFSFPRPVFALLLSSLGRALADRSLPFLTLFHCAGTGKSHRDSSGLSVPSTPPPPLLLSSSRG